LRLLTAVLVLLVLANILLYAAGEGYFGGQEEGREPQRLANQLAPEKLRIVGSRPVSPAANGNPAPAAAAKAPVACRALTGLSLEQARELEAELVAEARTSDWQVSIRLADAGEGRQKPGAQLLLRGAAAEKRVAELAARYPAAASGACPP